MFRKEKVAGSKICESASIKTYIWQIKVFGNLWGDKFKRCKVIDFWAILSSNWRLNNDITHFFSLDTEKNLQIVYLTTKEHHWSPTKQKFLILIFFIKIEPTLILFIDIYSAFSPLFNSSDLCFYNKKNNQINKKIQNE